MVPSSPMMDRYNTSTSSRLDMPPTGVPDPSVFDRERATGPSISRESSKYTTASHAYSSRSSTLPLAADNMSEITSPTSVAEMEEMADFVRAGPGDGEAKIFEGYARLFERIASAQTGTTTRSEGEGSDIYVLKKFVEDAKEALKRDGEATI